MPTYLSCHLSLVTLLLQHITTNHNISLSLSLSHTHTHAHTHTHIYLHWYSSSDLPLDLSLYICGNFFGTSEIWSVAFICDLIVSFLYYFYFWIKNIELLFTNLKIHHFKVYNSVILSIFGLLYSFCALHNVEQPSLLFNSRIFLSLKKMIGNHF